MTGTLGSTRAATSGAHAADRHAAWRAARDRALRAPHGWLSPTALLWPTSTPGRLPGLPGEWWVADDRLLTRAVAGDESVLVGELVEYGGPTAVSVAEGRSLVLGTFLPAGRSGTASDGDPDGGSDGEREVAVEVVRRTGRYGLRPRDPLAPTRTGFTGVPAFAYDPAWVLDAPVRWYDEPAPRTVGAARPRLVHHVEAVGEIEVRHDGATHVLVLTGSRTRPTVLFTDEADGVAPWRVVDVEAADEQQGTVRVDLNRATNLPFAFTDHGTCPAPVPGNHLPFAVTAGERAPR